MTKVLIIFLYVLGFIIKGGLSQSVSNCLSDSNSSILKIAKKIRQLVLACTVTNFY